MVRRARLTGPRRRRDETRRPVRAAEPLRLPEPEEREAYRVLDFALRAGEVLLSGGAGAADVTAIESLVTSLAAP